MTPLRCQVGLNGLNFFTGAIQTAFGPFFTVYLTQQGWSQVDIGFALSVGTASALIFQLPAGGAGRSHPPQTALPSPSACCCSA